MGREMNENFSIHNFMRLKIFCILDVPFFRVKVCFQVHITINFIGLF